MFTSYGRMVAMPTENQELARSLPDAASSYEPDML
jgi:hypothetical protein